MMNLPPQMVNLFQTLKTVNNPMEMLMQQFAGNPQKLAQFKSMTQGKSPQEIEQTARNYAKTIGVDIDQIVRQLGM